jgi:hypothetical protein
MLRAPETGRAKICFQKAAVQLKDPKAVITFVA